ncbi:NUDIX hydrolase [Kribbella sp. CA-253562]|uniref:NUDIX hydrolase n=1 Tax=Kribbella sp. CA-253562 TaxID=3239942 RepID=UPI003D927EAB
MKLLSSGRLPGLDLPHRSDLVASTELPPYELISTAFVLIFDRSSRLLLRYADLPTRGGWDLPGGHVELGETPTAAAIREVDEESGWPLRESDLTVLGWNRFSLEAPKPSGFRYPYPVGYLAYFVARLTTDGQPTTPAADSECSLADWLTPAEVRTRCADRRWLPLLDHQPE